MSLLFLDFETRSLADLPAVGTYRYAEHESTEVLCVASALDDGDVILSFTELETEGDFFVAHNCEFERNILRAKFGVDIPWDRWIDTAAMAARMSLPRSLDGLAEFFGLDTELKKLANVQRKGDAVTRPRRPSKDNPDLFWTPKTKPEGFKALYDRCKHDVWLTREVYKRLLPMEEKEREIWQVTLNMNDRGVKVDLPSIPRAKAVIEADSKPQIAEFELMVGEKLKSYARVAKALGMPDVRKVTVRKALRNKDIPLATRRALEILQALSKSSVAKLDAMEARAHADGRVRGSFLYCGAERTARWSSSGVQFQNFKRGLGVETQTAFDALHNDCLQYLFDGADRPAPDPKLTPTGVIAEMLRGFILGPFFVGDLAQIEARGIAWLADDEEQLQLFREKGDPYCAMASVIYGQPVSKKEKDKRFMGKQAELGCGYGLGHKGFIRMLDEIYDVQIDEDFSQRVVNAYRRRHPKIVAFWDRLGRGFVHVVATKKEKVRITKNIFAGYFVHRGTAFAYIELPSGRRLYYGKPELDSTPKGACVKYWGRDRFSGGWNQIRTYGGKLAENVTQAISRDVIAEAMLRLHRAGYPLVMTVHDEIVAEDDDSKDLEEFKKLMEIAPDWAKGLPIEVDSFRTFRYRK